VQVAQGGEDVEHVGDGLRHRQRLALLLAVPVARLPEGLAAHVLHDDVAGPVVLDEVVDPHDVRVLDLGEEAALGDGRRHGRLVVGVEEALEDHPPVRHVPVLGQVHPAEPAVGDAAGHLVLPPHQVVGPELRRVREGSPAVGAEALGPPRHPVAAAPDRLAAAAADPLPLGDLGVGEDHRQRVAERHRRHVDQSRAERAPAGARRSRVPGGRGGALGGGRPDRRGPQRSRCPPPHRSGVRCVLHRG
jgi:hypothetical protein